VLLDLTFCIYLVREILFLSGKNTGIFKHDVCGNHVREKGNTKTCDAIFFNKDLWCQVNG